MAPVMIFAVSFAILAAFGIGVLWGIAFERDRQNRPPSISRATARDLKRNRADLRTALGRKP